MTAMMLAPLVLTVALQQGLPPINAARDAKAKVEAAQQKNTDADQKPPSTAPGQGTQAPAPQPTQPPSTGSGQAAPPQPAPPQPAGQPGAPAAVPPPASGGGYTYDPGGRRDPFVSLLTHGEEAHPAGAGRPPGLPGIFVNEISVKGILKTTTGFTALVQGPDKKTYVAHAGDHVMDGTIKSITQDAVVFSQDVTDPLSLVKQREVRKTIRPETR